jgi:hypothetical protein
MNECYQHNLSLIAKRWPELYQRLESTEPESVEVIEGLDSTLLVNGIQLTSRHDRQAEASLQLRHIKEDQAEVSLYGCGLGDVQQQLLQRPALKKLYVHIMNENIFLLVIRLLDQSFWLADPRVELRFADQQTELKQPFVCLPAERHLASDSCHKIKLRLHAEEELKYMNQNTHSHADQFVHRIEETRPFWSSDLPVNKLYNQLDPKREVFVIATGPSLEQQFDYLKARQQKDKPPLLIAVDTALHPLLQHGIVPDIVVTVEIRVTVQRMLSLPVPSDVALVYFPLTTPAVLENWPGPRYIAMNTTPALGAIRHQLKTDYLYTFGSVLHPALDLAIKMQARQIVLFGADFGYANNKTHAVWQDGALGPKFEAGQEWILNGYGEKIKSLRNLQYYLIGAERLISQHPQIRFYNSSKAGAVISGTSYYPELIQ